MRAGADGLHHVLATSPPPPIATHHGPKLCKLARHCSPIHAHTAVCACPRCSTSKAKLLLPPSWHLAKNAKLLHHFQRGAISNLM